MNQYWFIGLLSVWFSFFTYMILIAVIPWESVEEHARQTISLVFVFIPVGFVILFHNIYTGMFTSNEVESNE